MSDLEVNSAHKYLFLCVAKNVQNDKELCNLAMLYASKLTMHALAEAQSQAPGFEGSLGRGSDMHVSLCSIEDQSESSTPLKLFTIYH